MTKKTNRNLLTVLWLWLTALFAGPLAAQEMYPGDINDNGVVNAVDVLYWGVAFGSTGPERDDATTDFIPQLIMPWGAAFPNGVNYAFADVDGSGLVDEEDLGEDDDDDEGLAGNFGLTHGIVLPDPQSPPGTPGVDPLLAVNPDLSTATGGQQVNVTFSLGDAATPAANFYGIAFSINYNPGLIDPGDIIFELPPSPWYDPGGGASGHLVVSDLTPGRVDVAITRINQTPTSGFGELGTLTFVIIEDVVGAIQVDSSFEVAELLFVDPGLNTLPVTRENQGPLSSRTIAPPAGRLRLWPNPAHRAVFVEGLPHPPLRAVRYDALGRAVRLRWQQAGRNRYRIDLGDCPAGFYFLSLYTKQGLLTERLYVRRE